jgi:hypothetical protein
MSKASTTLDTSIEDATILLGLFDEVHDASPERADAFKKAAPRDYADRLGTYVEAQFSSRNCGHWRVGYRLRSTSFLSLAHASQTGGPCQDGFNAPKN